MLTYDGSNTYLHLTSNITKYKQRKYINSYDVICLKTISHKTTSLFLIDSNC